MIIFLSGIVKAELRGHPYAGYMMQPGMRNRPDLGCTHWAADNGCFAAGDGFRLQFLENMLDNLDDYKKTCLFAVAPDVVGDPIATLRRSLPVMPRLRTLGWPVAFVAQDEQENLPLPWDEFDCLFIGGTDVWKLSPPQEGHERVLSAACQQLIYEAKCRGKWAHIGRVNSFRRLRCAKRMGADSADGTFLRSAPDQNLPRVLRWLERLQQEPELPLFEEGASS